MKTLSQIKKICDDVSIAPSKLRGQNFLIDGNVVRKIIHAVDPKPKEKILEVGPGLGVLTDDLIGSGADITAVELDNKIFAYLSSEFAKSKNLSLIHENILDVDISRLGLKPGQYKIVANLPYNITSVFLRNFLSEVRRPRQMFLMVQLEVAQRIMARPGDMSLLAVSVQFYADPRILFRVDKNCFWPKPKVDSAFICLNLDKKEYKISEKKFFQLVKIGFSAKRKQLHNNLSAGLRQEGGALKSALKSVNLSEKIRAQDLALTDWLDLADELIKVGLL